MISIPLPFILSILLMILATMVLMKRGKSALPSFLCIGLCALTTAVVGLRWTYDLSSLRMIQPILASMIPFATWYCFTRVHYLTPSSILHIVGPLVIVIATVQQGFYFISIDVILTILYLGYAFALLYSSYRNDDLLEEVCLTDWEWARKAEKTAGFMLLLSASIDLAMSIDATFNEGDYALYILSVGHTVLIPILALAVLVTSASMRPSEIESSSDNSKLELNETRKEQASVNSSSLSRAEAEDIVAKIKDLMERKEIFLDPDLTLRRISRKLSIPSRQISIAINMIFKRNVSKVINEYRIARAKELLQNTDDNITTIFLNSGFQTKSNFNREFTRITGLTPSSYRQTRI